MKRAWGAVLLAMASSPGGRADIAVAKVDTAATYSLCDGNGNVVQGQVRFTTLKPPCGTSIFPCPVFVKEHSTSTGQPAVPCDSALQIQGMATGDGSIETPKMIHAYVYGFDNGLVGNSEMAVAYNVLWELCNLPCLNGNVYTCVDHPDDCPSGVPLMIVQNQGVVASPLSEAGPFELRGKFDPPIDETTYEVPKFFAEPAEPFSEYDWPPAHLEIEEGDNHDCGSLMGTEVTPEEAYMPDSCGSAFQPPCPLADIEGNIFGQCHDDIQDTCLDVELFLDGAHDPDSYYCKNGECPRMGSFIKRFRLVLEKELWRAGTPLVPIGAWRDMCPYVCDSSTAASNVCVASADHCLNGTVADNPPTFNPPTWQYDLPGSRYALVKYVGHTAVKCDYWPTSAPTVTPTGTGESTETGDPTETTAPGGQTSRATRAVVGGLTALMMAAGVLYL